MLRKIEYLIPAALKAINDHMLIDDHADGIPTGYQGAISGFGTSLIQMGLLPTLAVYTDQDNDAKIDRALLLKTLFAIVLNEESKLRHEYKTAIPVIASNPKVVDTRELLSKLALVDFRDELKEHLLQAALAFKLCIRTYHLKKEL